MHLTSVQLFLNPIKTFDPFLYIIELRSTAIQPRKSRFSIPCIVPENNIPTQKQNFIEHYSKLKIEHKSEGKALEFSEYEWEYKSLIFNETQKIIHIIEAVSKKTVKSICAKFVIHKTQIFEVELWLVNCENICFDLTSINGIPNKQKDANIGTNENYIENIEPLPKFSKLLYHNLWSAHKSISKKPEIIPPAKKRSSSIVKYNSSRPVKSLTRGVARKNASILKNAEKTLSPSLIVKKANPEICESLETLKNKVLKEYDDLANVKPKKRKGSILIKIKGMVKQNSSLDQNLSPKTIKMQKNSFINKTTEHSNLQSNNSPFITSPSFRKTNIYNTPVINQNKQFKNAGNNKNFQKRSNSLLARTRTNIMENYREKILSDASPYFMCKGEEVSHKEQPAKSLNQLYDEIMISQKPLEKPKKEIKKLDFRKHFIEKKKRIEIKRQSTTSIDKKPGKNDDENIQIPVFNVVVRHAQNVNFAQDLNNKIQTDSINKLKSSRFKVGKCNVYEINYLPEILNK